MSITYLLHLITFGIYFAAFYSFANPQNGIQDMVAYEFYWRDEKEKEHFIGILPERRKDPERITEEAILNWGWKVIVSHSDVKNIYFVKIEMD